MKTYQVEFGGYWERNRIQFSIQAKDVKQARKQAELALTKAFRSFSWTIYSIKVA